MSIVRFKSKNFTCKACGVGYEVTSITYGLCPLCKLAQDLDRDVEQISKCIIGDNVVVLLRFRRADQTEYHFDTEVWCQVDKAIIHAMLVDMVNSNMEMEAIGITRDVLNKLPYRIPYSVVQLIRDAFYDDGSIRFKEPAFEDTIPF